MDLVNLMYQYINKFINVDALIYELRKIDLKPYQKNEIIEINILISKLKKVRDDIPNEKDEVEIERLHDIENIMKILEDVMQFDTNDENAKVLIHNKYEQLKSEKETTKDGGKLYNTVSELMTKNYVVIKYYENMNNVELLEFITQYISVPKPPTISQKKFDELTKIGIKNDARETLWRLAFNYGGKNITFTLIQDYFIDCKDSYYLTELICAVQEDLDVINIINKILLTNDKQFMNECASRAIDCGIATVEQVNEVIDSYKKIAK